MGLSLFVSGAILNIVRMEKKEYYSTIETRDSSGSLLNSVTFDSKQQYQLHLAIEKYLQEDMYLGADLEEVHPKGFYYSCNNDIHKICHFRFFMDGTAKAEWEEGLTDYYVWAQYGKEIELGDITKFSYDLIVQHNKNRIL